MTRDEKGAVIADLHEKFARAKVAILTESSGLPVTQVSQLRKQLRGAGAELCVIKNTMAARAAEGTALLEVKAYLKGPLALVIGYDDPGTQELAELPHCTHQIGGGDGLVELHPPAFDFFDELVGPDELRPSLPRLLLLLAFGEDQDPNLFPSPMGKDRGAPHHLISPLGLNAQTKREIDGLVEFRIGGLFHEACGFP